MAKFLIGSQTIPNSNFRLFVLKSFLINFLEMSKLYKTPQQEKANAVESMTDYSKTI